MKAVILAAGKGSRLAPLTDDRPKPLVDVGGKPLLVRTIERLAEVGITGKNVIVVAGYREDVLRARLADRHVAIVTNPRYDDWNNFWSLAVAEEAVGKDGFLQVDGDVLFDRAVLPRVLAAPGPCVLAVDVRPELDDETMKVITTGPERRIQAISKTLDSRAAIGEYIGVTRVDAALAPQVFAELRAMADEGITHEYYEFAYHRLIQRGVGPFRAVDVGDCSTVEIDNVDDLRRAEALIAKERIVA